MKRGGYQSVQRTFVNEINSDSRNSDNLAGSFSSNAVRSFKSFQSISQDNLQLLLDPGFETDDKESSNSNSSDEDEGGLDSMLLNNDNEEEITFSPMKNNKVI